MDKVTLPQKTNSINTKVCSNSRCMHDGAPQPAKYFRGRGGVEYAECSDCRLGARGRSIRDRRMERVRRLGLHPAPRQHPFKMPPGCEAAAGAVESLIGQILARCPEGEGLPVLADPLGRVIVKQVAGLRGGEICLVIR